MSKVHVIKDENLGGVLREFVEVDRKAKDGDFAVFKTEHKGIAPGKPYEITVTGGMIEFYDDNGEEHWWTIPSEELTIVEPTDIVHIDDPSGQPKRYRMVERRVRIGEKVLITVDSIFKGVAFTVSGFDSDGDLVFKESDHYYAKHGDYVVLETVEQSPSVLDMLANLSEQIVKLNRRIDRLADANEQAITTVARDVERVDADLIKLRKEFEDSKGVNLTLSSELVAKLIEKGLND
jgi:hypothetical protein